MKTDILIIDLDVKQVLFFINVEFYNVKFIVKKELNLDLTNLYLKYQFPKNIGHAETLKNGQIFIKTLFKQHWAC